MSEAKIVDFPPGKDKLPARFSEMLSLAKFQKALGVATRHTLKTGLETGFKVSVLPDSSFWIEEVMAGGTDGMEYSRALKEIDGSPDFNLPIMEFFNFHFHPSKDGPIIPSPSDLHLFRVSQPEFVGIGQVDETGKVKMVVISKPKYHLTRSDIDFYDQEVDEVRSQEEVRPLLAAIGLSSFLLEI